VPHMSDSAAARAAGKASLSPDASGVGLAALVEESKVELVPVRPACGRLLQLHAQVLSLYR
jgi:hypothetical protein